MIFVSGEIWKNRKIFKVFLHFFDLDICEIILFWPGNWEIQEFDYEIEYLFRKNYCDFVLLKVEHWDMRDQIERKKVFSEIMDEKVFIYL